MLQYNNWTIEQSEWLPEEELNLEQQLSFSNGYLCQTAHFEECYSQAQQLRTYIKGIETPILNISSISIRLHDERLDLAQWDIKQFYRCLHKNTPMLERRVTATSPKGTTLHIHSTRQLLSKQEVMQITYKVTSENYTGPISFLAMLGGENEPQNWYPLMNNIEQDKCWIWLQLPNDNIQLCCAMNWQVLHNDIPVGKRPIKIEKHHTIGYSLTTQIKAGESCTLKKNVAVLDSRNHSKDQLIANTLKCLTNW